MLHKVFWILGGIGLVALAVAIVVPGLFSS